MISGLNGPDSTSRTRSKYAITRLPCTYRSVQGQFQSHIRLAATKGKPLIQFMLRI
jgi:hypothetical protein